MYWTAPDKDHTFNFIVSKSYGFISDSAGVNSKCVVNIMLVQNQTSAPYKPDKLRTDLADTHL
jgi:hypothetical protein